MKKLLIFPLLGIISTVSAHTGEIEDPEFAWNEYLITLAIIFVVLVLALRGLIRFQSRPGSLPIKKLTIASGITFIVNAIIIAIVYLEV